MPWLPIVDRPQAEEKHRLMELFDWQAFHFLRPLALLGVIPALLLAAWYFLRRAGSELFESLLSAELQTALLSGGKGAKAWLTPACIATLLGLGAIAVAGPTWQRQEIPARELDDALVVLLDLSLSMYAQDVQPSRLDRAQLELADLLNLREEGTTALIAYAGDAHVVTPLTDDVETIRHMANSLSPDIMPVLGSRTDEAIRLANQLLQNSAQDLGRVLLITDGIRGLEASAGACDPRFALSILGVGSATGAPVPVPVGDGQTQMLKDARGNQVIAQLDESKLKELANLCGGEYSEVRVGDEDLLTLLPGIAETAGQFTESQALQQVDMWVDMTYLIALPLVPLLLFAFRRGALPILLLCLLLPPDASASWWDDLWKRRDQQGYEALQEEDPQTAAGLFNDQRWRGVSHFRGQFFEDAISAFDSTQAKHADDYYNLGNSLAYAGNIPEAIAAYDNALALSPDHEDAAHNKSLLESMQGNPSPNQSQQDQDQQNQSDSDKGQSSPSSQDAPQDSQEPTESEQPSEASDEPQTQPEQQERSGQENQPQDQSEPNEQTDLQAADSPAQATSQEDSQASQDRQRELIESLLRRVPDDPGGLLRQKFLYETRERSQAGQPRQDSEEPW